MYIVQTNLKISLMSKKLVTILACLGLWTCCSLMATPNINKYDTNDNIWICEFLPAEKLADICANNVEIVLIGIVLEEESKKPLAGVRVALKQLNTETELDYVTKEDGTFYFNLHPDAAYEVLAANEAWTSEPKQLLTAGIEGSKILHTVLQLPDNQ